MSLLLKSIGMDASVEDLKKYINQMTQSHNSFVRLNSFPKGKWDGRNGLTVETKREGDTGLRIDAFHNDLWLGWNVGTGICNSIKIIDKFQKENDKRVRDEKQQEKERRDKEKKGKQFVSLLKELYKKYFTASHVLSDKIEQEGRKNGFSEIAISKEVNKALKEHFKQYRDRRDDLIKQAKTYGIKVWEDFFRKTWRYSIIDNPNVKLMDVY